MNRGFSLLELLVALALTGLLATAVQSYSLAVGRSVRLYGEMGELEETASLALHLVSQDLRGAGYSPHGGLSSRIQTAEIHRVAINHDWNGDGDSDDSNERIAYQLASNRRVLQRRLGGAAPQPFLDGLALDGLRFAYFDASGQALIPPLAPAERALVRRIDLELTLSLPCDTPSCAPATMQRTASVHIRND